MKRDKSLELAIRYAKRKADKEMYSFGEMIEDAAVEYLLREEDEIPELKRVMKDYCKKNHLYLGDDLKGYDFTINPELRGA